MKPFRTRIVATALAVVIGTASIAEASAPKEPEPQSVASSEGVKVVTYNLQGNVLTNFNESTRIVSLTKINMIVETLLGLDADVILLQEVSSGESEGGLNILEAIRNQLALRTGKRWYRKFVVKCVERGFKPGKIDVVRQQAILSTAPITKTSRWHNDALANSKWERGDSNVSCPAMQPSPNESPALPRALISAETHGLRVTSVHLAPKKYKSSPRAADIKRMLSEDSVVAKGKYATARGYVIAGDFNSTDAQIQGWLKNRPAGAPTLKLISEGEGPTKNNSTSRIDHIYASAKLSRVGDVEVVGEESFIIKGKEHFASDHKAVAATIAG